MSAEVFPEVPAGALLQVRALPYPPAPPTSPAEAGTTPAADFEPASLEQELRSSGLLLGLLVFVVLLGVGLGLLAHLVGAAVQP